MKKYMHLDEWAKCAFGHSYWVQEQLSLFLVIMTFPSLSTEGFSASCDAWDVIIRVYEYRCFKQFAPTLMNFH